MRSAIFSGQSSRAYFKVYDGVYDMLGELNRQGVKVWLLSNAQAIFTMPELEQLGLVRYFDGIAISSDAGFKKPDAEFAAYLFAKYPEADITPEKCLMVGNEYGSDGKVAENAGMNFLYCGKQSSPRKVREPNTDTISERMNSYTVRTFEPLIESFCLMRS